MDRLFLSAVEGSLRVDMIEEGWHWVRTGLARTDEIPVTRVRKERRFVGQTHWQGCTARREAQDRVVKPADDA